MMDGLAVSYEHLAELESKKGKAFLHFALQYIDKAFATPSLSFKAGPTYYPLHIRGRILRDLGRDPRRLSRTAARPSMPPIRWRQSALPGDATNTKTVQMLNETYHDFADFAAEQSHQARRPGTRPGSTRRLGPKPRRQPSRAIDKGLQPTTRPIPRILSPPCKTAGSASPRHARRRSKGARKSGSTSAANSMTSKTGSASRPRISTDFPRKLFTGIHLEISKRG